MNEFELQKEMYFDEVYKNEGSKTTLRNIYQKNIKHYEEILNKDLAYFSIEELDSLISSIPSNSIHIKASVYSFCNQYLDWCISKRLISINNMSALPRETYIEIGQKLASSRLISYEQFWDMIRFMEIHTDIQNILPIIMAYYCIGGNDLEYMRNLTIDDLDEVNEVVYIRLQGDLKVVIPIDEQFISYCKKANEEDNIGVEYVPSRLILKPTLKGRNDVVPENTAYMRIYKAFDDSGIKRIRLNDLAKSRKIALLLEDIRRTRFLTRGDFQDICEMFNPNCSIGYSDSLIKYYQMASQDKVLKKFSKEEDLIDLNCEENYQKILKRLGWS